MEDDDLAFDGLSPQEAAEGEDEMRFLEELGMGADGSHMQIGDEAWDGSGWAPDRPAGVINP